MTPTRRGKGHEHGQCASKELEALKRERKQLGSGMKRSRTDSYFQILRLWRVTEKYQPLERIAKEACSRWPGFELVQGVSLKNSGLTLSSGGSAKGGGGGRLG